MRGREKGGGTWANGFVHASASFKMLMAINVLTTFRTLCGVSTDAPLNRNNKRTCSRVNAFSYFQGAGTSERRAKPTQHVIIKHIPGGWEVKDLVESTQEL